MENYIVSARKYRPMTFSAVVGQEALTTTLKNAVKGDKLAHAYLFCGPRGVGKTTCARIFAKTINCEHPSADGEACNECSSCKSFNEGRSMNIFELDAASNNSVENIKTLMEQTQIPPQTGRYKVFIIDEVHMLSTSAFNAFLKTLEEPPAHVIFILATTEKHKILPTILSRCQIYDFERMTVPETIDHLKKVADQEGISYEEEALGIIAEKADGGMRDALSIFDQVASYCQGNITFQKVLEDLNVLDAENYFHIIDLAIENKVSDIMVLVNRIIAKGFDAGNLINGLASHVRNVMMANDPQTLPLLEVSQQQRQKYQEQAKKCPKRFLYQALKIMNECDVNYRQSSNKRLLAELTLIRVAQITQPSDDDAEGAGRSPKCLKILFKNIKTSQPKPAQQVAGAEKRVQAAAELSQAVAANSSAISPNEAKTHNIPQNTTHAKPSASRVKLKNVGITFGNLRRGVQQPNSIAVSKAEEKSVPDNNKKFTEEELSIQWTLMCNRMPQRLVGLASRLKNITPHIADYPNIEVVIDNEILLSQVNDIKNSIAATMKKTLGNDGITVSLKLADIDNRRRAYTKREIFDELRQKNPAIEKLRVKLGLELA
ncbi:DNA polymerase III, subunit gamma and tau [Hallella bergensis DSM 17361]|uniref:DNA polymerase III subunit gamma/tau n=1 Tax=Hallella bergensis DSM 17361 TaxID=585502 RepID=D1PXH9_9BACT|nr:DNA polymerase III subunit gamma/tau [Hallella bergensis]EFA43946.1 DNA polymerase III, subunit gamma and tau [Hallella bergensis DSM 17361]